MTCPTLPSTFKMLAASATLAGGETHTFSFETPGVFCPYKMLIFTPNLAQLASLFVTSIKSGIEEQIIRGSVTAELWSPENSCCSVACLKCLCSPGVDYNVTIFNGNGTIPVSVVLLGSYLDACDPRPDELPDVPGCPTPGSDKIIGFQTVFLDAGETETLTITTPGKFCPRVMFTGGSADLFTIEGIRSGLKNQLIGVGLPANLFSADNDCCTLACFDCLCLPGYPLYLDFLSLGAGEGPARLFGALIGSFEDYCP